MTAETKTSGNGTACEYQGANDYPYGKKYSYGILLLLTLLYAFDFIDRQVISTMMHTLKMEWSLSDKQLGLLVAIVNWSIAIFAFPAALLVDRWSRKNMVAIMATIWGLATLACAFSGNFTQLLLLRFLVGTGEAGYGPGSNSIIESYFPPKKINGALGILQSGGTFGCLIGVVIGGIIVKHFGWRHAFGIVAVPGILVALIVFFIKEPPKRILCKINAATGQEENVPFKQVLKKLFTTPTLVIVYFSMAMTLIFAICISNWMPLYFARMEGLDPQQAAFKSAVVLFCNGTGVVIGGIVADRFSRRRENGHLYCAAFYMFMTAISFGLAFTIAPQNMVFPLLLFGSLFVSSPMGPAYNTIMKASPCAARATAVGTMVVVQNVFGMGLGAFMTGTLSDFYTGLYKNGRLAISEHAMNISNGDTMAASLAMGLKSSLASLAMAPVLAGVLFIAAAFFFSRDVAKADQF